MGARVGLTRWFSFCARTLGIDGGYGGTGVGGVTLGSDAPMGRCDSGRMGITGTF